MEKSRKPKIRFKGYNDDWEQRELGELILEYKKTVDSSCTLPVLTSSKTEGVILQEEHFGRKQQHDITGYNVLPRSFCTYRNRSDGVDFTFNVNECCDMGIISKFYPVFCGNDNDTFFLSLVLNNSDEVVHEIAFTCIGTGQKVLSFLDLQKMSIRVPKQSEQKKISTYFKQLDDLITLHQRKLDKLINVKKSMLEKMFPKQGSTVPEVRFSGFTEDWEQRELGELILEYKKTVDSSCTLPVLTSSKTEGVILQEEHFGRKQQHDITGYNVLPRSFCTYRNRSDGVDFTFNVNECCDMGIISKFYPVFCGNDNDTFFLSLVLNNSDEVVHEIAFTCIGTGQKVLSFLDLQKMSIRVPKQSEQKKISTYFKQLDDLITLHQRKLEKLKNIKKSMLEKMFI